MRGRAVGESVQLGEVGAGLQGMKQGFLPAVEATIQSLQTGVTPRLRGEAPGKKFAWSQSTVGAPEIKSEATREDVTAAMYGMMRGIKEAFVGGDTIQSADPNGKLAELDYTGTGPSGAIPAIVSPRYGIRVPLGEIVRSPMKMHTAVHTFFATLAERYGIHQRAFREAARDGFVNEGLAAEAARRAQNPKEEWLADTSAFGREQALMGPAARFTRDLARFVNREWFPKLDENNKPIPYSGIPLLKFVDPFIQISSNIINESLVKRTPLGALLSKSVRADLMGKNGAARADLAAARMVVGSAFGMLFGTLAAEGYVTGSGPSDPADRATWRMVYQAHSIRIGDTWYAMNRLGALGMLASTAADLYDVSHSLSQGELLTAATALGHAFSQNVLDESFMRGPSELIRAVNEPGRYGERYLQNFVSSFLPFSSEMWQMARISDPYARQARGIVDALMQKTPLLSMSLLPLRDRWGEPLPSREGLGPTAIWEQKVNSDPVNLALLKGGFHIPVVQRTIRNVHLTDQQYDDYQRISGRLLKMGLDRIVRAPSWNNMTPEAQHNLIQEQIRQSREVARGKLFGLYHNILVDANAIKQAGRRRPPQ
jgi:hypothetical protein